MRTKITTLILALMFSVTFAGVSHAAKCKGEIESIDGGKMVVKVDGKCDAKAGESVTMKTKKGGAVEGC